MFCHNKNCNNPLEPNFAYCRDCLEKIKIARPDKKKAIDKRLKKNK